MLKNINTPAAENQWLSRQQFSRSTSYLYLQLTLNFLPFNKAKVRKLLIYPNIFINFAPCKQQHYFASLVIRYKKTERTTIANKYYTQQFAASPKREAFLFLYPTGGMVDTLVLGTSLRVQVRILCRVLIVVW